ncbi:unknown [Hungatella hathewayi CAG:224]|nr:unknown [Hungatella hathewayi CAG:224]
MRRKAEPGMGDDARFRLFSIHTKFDLLKAEPKNSFHF